MARLDETVSYYSHHEAALGLSAALKTLDEIEADRSRWSWSMPPHEEDRRDRAVARVRAAVRYLCTEEDE